MTNNDSISQHKAIQLSNLKQFNCSIEKKNIHLHIVEGQNSYSHQIKKTKPSTVRTTLPVITNVIAEEEACLSVRLLLQPTKIIQLSNSDCFHQKFV